MKKDDKFSEFFLKLYKLAAEAEIPLSSYKHECSFTLFLLESFQ